jgi:putative phage-type endonuclease
MAALLGLSPYKTPISLWAEKTGRLEPEVANENAVLWGKTLEPVIAKHFAEINGAKITNQTRHGQLNKYPYLTGEFDYKIVEGFGEHGILEVKTASAYLSRDWGKPQDDEDDIVPPHYYIQEQWYMHVFKVDFAIIAVLIGGQDYREYMIERDPLVGGHIEEKAIAFWKQNVIADVQPTLVYPDDADVLNKLYQSKAYGSNVADDEAELLIANYREGRAKEKAAANMKGLSKAKLLALMKDKGRILDKDGDPIVVRTTVSAQRVDWKSMAGDLLKELPRSKMGAMFSKHTTTATSMRLTVKSEKE